MVEMIAPLLVTILASYFLGNINGAITVSGLFEKDDVRSHGSGNAGMTNFLRSYGMKRTGLVLLIDLGKTLLSCFLGKLLLEPFGYALEGTMLAGFFVSLGHDFPALQGFKGGKGIACGLGFAMACDWRLAIVAVAVFAILVLLTRYVSLGSCIGTLVVGIWLTLFNLDRPWFIVFVWAACGLALFMHRGNIKRLFQGNERKISLRNKEEKA